jgi:hypothetical protein
MSNIHLWNSDIPVGQFNFCNNFDDISAAITFSTVVGAYKPFYQQPAPTTKHGTASFTPQKSYKIWLQQNVDESFM